MTLQGMRYIVEIADSSSLSKAANKLFVTQSALSAAVRDVETELGTVLFYRTNRGVTLTNDGEDFVRYARDIVAQTDYLAGHYQNREEAPTYFSVSTQRLPFAVRAFRDFLNENSFSNYNMALRESPTQTVIDDVGHERSELGVVALHHTHVPLIQKALTQNNLVFTEICPLRAYVFLRKSHPLAGKKILTLEELKEYPFVTYDQENAPLQYTEEAMFYDHFSQTIHVNDRCTKIALVRGTDCFSIGPDLPNSNADSFHRGSGEVVAIPLAEKTDSVHVGYLTKTNHTLSNYALKYLHLLNRQVEELKKYEEN